MHASTPLHVRMRAARCTLTGSHLGGGLVRSPGSPRWKSAVVLTARTTTCSPHPRLGGNWLWCSPDRTTTCSPHTSNSLNKKTARSMDEPRGALELTSVWRWSQFHRTPTQRAETSRRQQERRCNGGALGEYRRACRHMAPRLSHQLRTRILQPRLWCKTKRWVWVRAR